ncbi:MAG: divergent polysaccharide deacetylase family protein [Alphaproteobacteria bacterium]|nr:divergent polysaccharide deacetylase family protein [Alphaproteobacteria bacterium]
MRFLKPKDKESIKFIAIAVTAMVLVNHFVFDKHGYHEQIKEEYYAEKAAERALLQAQRYDPVAEDYYTKNPPQMVYPEDGNLYFEQVSEVAEPKVEIKPEPAVEEKPVVVEKPVPQRAGSKPKIAIVIDDIGMNRKWSKAAIDLPAGVTLALLPYAEKVRSDAKAAKEKGHELIIHTPMEAMTPDLDYGGVGLMTDMSLKELSQTFDKLTQSFDGYVGVNNHMGSKLTQDEAAMHQLMSILKTRRLYFLDSRTIHTSVAGKVAEEIGLPYAVRDVFLDHEITDEYIQGALANTERIAREHGQAIAIGHPKKETITALQEWLPTLESKGFELVALSDIVQTPSEDRDE